MPHRGGATTCAHLNVRWMNIGIGKCADCGEMVNRGEKGEMIGSVADQHRVWRKKKDEMDRMSLMQKMHIES